MSWEWVEEQISKRKESDEAVLNSAYDTLVDSILGEKFSFRKAEKALIQILEFYNFKNIKINEKITDDYEQLESVCRKTGMMHRRVILDNDWYKTAFGAFFAKLKDGGDYIALLPDYLGRYFYFEPGTFKKVLIDKSTERNIEKEAECFYKPMPSKKLSTFDLLRFGISSWSFFDYAITIGLLLLSTVLGLIIPKINYFLFGSVLELKSLSLLISTVVFLMTLQVTTSMIGGIKQVFSDRTNVKLTATVKCATMIRVLSLPVNFFRKYSSGEIFQRISYVEAICSVVVNMLFNVGASSAFSLAYITQIFSFAPTLVYPSIIIVLVNIVVSVITSHYQIKITKTSMEINAKNIGMGYAMINGIQKIKLSGSEKRMFSRWMNEFSKYTHVMYNPPTIIKMNQTLTLMMSLISQLVMYILALDAKLGVPEYYAFQSAYAMFSAAFTSLIGMALQFSKLRPYLEMSRPILETVPETIENGKEIDHLSGRIEVSNVSFRYDEDGPDIISNLSLNINPGQYLAIVGKTGCGKSTLVRLLLGFEKPQTGSIFYDAYDLNKIEKRSLRKKIGTVMQDDKLFTGDIFHNISICAPNISVDRAWEVAEIAGIADDIKALPMGMHTVIAEGAGGISGGQRQRLIIARAIAPKPQILIFDEATSALDNITQKKVSDALDSLKCTRIVIAHRLSTIKNCDRIIVLDKGKVIEDGTYDELVKAKGFFADLVDRQRLDK